MSKEDTGKRIAALLKSSGMTQHELAGRVGATESAISKYLSGNREPRAEALANIAAALGTTAEYLLGKNEGAETRFGTICYLCARHAPQMSMEERNRLISIIVPPDRRGSLMPMRLSDARYEQIKEAIMALFERYDVDCLPVDPWKLAHAMSLKLIAFSALTEEQLGAALQLSNGRLKFRLVCVEGISPQCILYDNQNPIGRQRFTILREIAHIALGHKQESELTDAEAGFFAKFAIAPPTLVHLLRSTDCQDIATAFGLSSECASNTIAYYKKWRRISSYKPYEHAPIALFAKKDETGRLSLRIRKSAQEGVLVIINGPPRKRIGCPCANKGNREWTAKDPQNNPIILLAGLPVSKSPSRHEKSMINGEPISVDSPQTRMKEHINVGL